VQKVKNAMTKKALAGDQGDLRQGNLAAIMTHLRHRTLLSRSDLAQITGLNPATITRLVRELIANNLVYETGMQFSHSGRPSIRLGLNPKAGTMIGAEIGIGSISVILTDFAPTLLWRTQVEMDLQDSPHTVIDQVSTLFRQACDYAQTQGLRVLGAGLGLPGLVDTTTGSLLFAPNLQWTDTPIQNLLQRALNLPVFVDNVASASALGESYLGVAQNYNNVLYLSTQGGLGGRFVINGTILRGAGGFAGEIGHMSVMTTGRRCHCGRIGCWETVASQVAVLQQIRERLESGQPSLLTEMTDGVLSRITIPLIIEAADAGDTVALEVLREAGHWLGVGLANLINMLNPDLVVIGGVLSLAHEYLLPEIEKVALHEPLKWLREDCKIVIAAHGANAVVMGGIATVYREIIQNPHRWM
jgi:glucokinase-like ROK family protein